MIPHSILVIGPLVCALAVTPSGALAGAIAHGAEVPSVSGNRLEAKVETPPAGLFRLKR